MTKHPNTQIPKEIPKSKPEERENTMLWLGQSSFWFRHSLGIWVFRHSSFMARIHPVLFVANALN
jgi:hypothetical protein